MDAVWADAAVEENSLARAIADIRRALGEGPKDKRFIETVAGRGYRFVANVTALPANPQQHPVQVPGAVFAPPDARKLTTLAVLPFSWLTPEGNDPSLSVGIADALIGRLSNLPHLVVRPTSSILRYATPGQDIASIGRDLGVDFVITGSIQQVDERVRVSVQMVTEGQHRSAWAARFDESFTHLFALEDSISERISEALVLKLTSAQSDSLTHPYTRNNDAYQLNLRGRYFLVKHNLTGASKAIEYFRQALQLDPGYALPWAGIAASYMFMGLPGALGGWLPPNESYPEAKRAAAAAIELQPDLAEAHGLLGFISFIYDWDCPAALRELKEALRLQPHNSNTCHLYAMMCCFIGWHDEAVAAIGKALEVEPLSLILNANRGYILYFARRYPEAIAQLRTTLEMDTSFPVAHHRLGLVYAACGSHSEAIDHFLQAREYSQESPQVLGALGYEYANSGDLRQGQQIFDLLVAKAKTCYVSAATMAEVCLGLGRVEETLEWLDEAVHERSSALVRLRVDPRFDVLRSDPRFRHIVEMVRIPREA